MKDLLTIKDQRLADVRFQDGALPHAMGVKTYQVMRANRAHPEWADGWGWTYNHAPMLAWYHGRFYLEYLSNPVDEHEVPGHTLLTTSDNGLDWSFPQVIFPVIEAPTWQYKGPRTPQLTDPIRTVAHQRMGFYHAPNGVLLALCFYGIIHDRKRSMPCDGWGVGRAVRRIFPDGALGDIHFLIYNEPAGYTRENLHNFPCYLDSADAAFIAACDALLADGAAMRQMYEEQRYDERLFPQKGEQALSFYTVRPGEMIGVYKKGLAASSADDGKTWTDIRPNPTLRTATGKVWGQRTSDGRFALMYNPTTDGQHRWPIAIVTGEDGHTFDHMQAVTGYMGPLRYGGLDKNLGPQYLRGICERNPQSPDGDIWLTYSNNKEDIWISRIPVPAGSQEWRPVQDDFVQPDALARWNVYSPLWAPVRAENGALALTDREPSDRASVERMLPPAERGELTLTLTVGPVSPAGAAAIELQDDAGRTPVLLSFRADGRLYVRSGGRTEPFAPYTPGEKLPLSLSWDCLRSSFTLTWGGQTSRHAFSASVHTVSRLCISTKELWQVPYADINTVGKYGTREQVLPGSEERTAETALHIHALSAKPAEE